MANITVKDLTSSSELNISARDLSDKELDLKGGCTAEPSWLERAQELWSKYVPLVGF
jgi:hypothetical protein